MNGINTWKTSYFTCNIYWIREEALWYHTISSHKKTKMLLLTFSVVIINTAVTRTACLCSCKRRKTKYRQFNSFLRQIFFCLFQNFFYQNKTTVSPPTSNVDCWRIYVQNIIPQHNKFVFLGIKSYGNNLGVFLFQNKVNHQSDALLITSLLNV